MERLLYSHRMEGKEGGRKRIVLIFVKIKITSLGKNKLRKTYISLPIVPSNNYQYPDVIIPDNNYWYSDNS